MAPALLLCALAALTLLGQATGFTHTQCFNHYGVPSGASVGTSHTAALVQGFEFQDTNTQIRVPRERLLLTSVGTGQGVPEECFSGNVSGEAALYHFSDDNGQFQLASCSVGRTADEMLRICLASCATMLDLGCRAVQLLPGPNHICQLHGESSANAVEVTSTQEDPYSLIMQLQYWRLCAEYPLRFRCSVRASSDEVYVGWLCLWDEPLDPSKYVSPANGALATEARVHPTVWRMALFRCSLMS